MPINEEEPSIKESSQAEITDPDDIDALLDSMPINEEEPSIEESSQAEITDPDDIDALLDSMPINEAEVDVADNTSETDEQPSENQGITRNKAKIDSLTNEYVAPLLAADFSDVQSKIEQVESSESQEGLPDDDFDIDSLLDDVESHNAEQEPTGESALDIGDDLAEGAFDEETLSELLKESSTDPVVELSPDFSDQNVLADLLNDDESDGNSQVSEASEINDIQELDSLDFDELLANIEEESTIASQSVDFDEDLDVGDDVSLADFDNTSSATSADNRKQAIKNEQDFLSVDSLLSESEDEEPIKEPYDKANIDVGLNEFPEFTDGVNPIDVDLDKNGMSAKLDLAKVYIEIGDQDNALAVLEEVVKQGDNQQQALAQELLDNL